MWQRQEDGTQVEHCFRYMTPVCSYLAHSFSLFKELFYLNMALYQFEEWIVETSPLILSCLPIFIKLDPKQTLFFMEIKITAVLLGTY